MEIFIKWLFYSTRYHLQLSIVYHHCANRRDKRKTTDIFIIRYKVNDINDFMHLIGRNRKCKFHFSNHCGSERYNYMKNASRIRRFERRPFVGIWLTPRKLVV
jgi:hypothetical protein